MHLSLRSHCGFTNTQRLCIVVAATQISKGGGLSEIDQLNAVAFSLWPSSWSLAVGAPCCREYSFAMGKACGHPSDTPTSRSRDELLRTLTEAPFGFLLPEMLGLVTVC